MKRGRRRKCLCCGGLFRPDPRNRRHQRYCSQPACRKASKAASQRRWLGKPDNRDYFRGRRVSREYRHGAPSIRGTGGALGIQRLRYKMSPMRKPLNHQRIRPL